MNSKVGKNTVQDNGKKNSDSETQKLPLARHSPGPGLKYGHFTS